MVQPKSAILGLFWEQVQCIYPANSRGRSNPDPSGLMGTPVKADSADFQTRR
jgi:hypothetical protein